MALSPPYHLWDKFHASKTGIATPKQDMDIFETG